jgi:hypothetical protein
MREDFPHWAYLLCNVLAAILSLIGLGGIPDSVRQWGRWIDMVGSDAGRWIVAVVAALLVVLANGGHRWLFRRIWSPTPAAEPKLVPSPPTAPSPISRDAPQSMNCPLCKKTSVSWLPWLPWRKYPSPCSKCKAIRFLPGEFLGYPECVRCGGNGRSSGHNENECEVCHGYGRRIPEKLRVDWEQLDEEQARRRLGM